MREARTFDIVCNSLAGVLNYTRFVSLHDADAAFETGWDMDVIGDRVQCTVLSRAPEYRSR